MAPIKVIVDTDPGVDDILALFLLLSSPEVEIVAITITFGNTTLDKAYNNILKVYQLIQNHINSHPEDASRYPNFPRLSRTGGGEERVLPKPIYARGAEGPIQGSMNLAEYFHGGDGMSDISTTNPEYDVRPSFWNSDGGNALLDTVTTPAHLVILDILKKEPEGSVTVVSLGPRTYPGLSLLRVILTHFALLVTNLSLALSTDPTTFARMQRLVSMGGALDVPGNTSPTTEFNFFADPWAAQHIYNEAQRADAKWKWVMVPLDVTSRHLIDFDAMVGGRGSLLEEQGKEEYKRAGKDIEEFLTVVLSRPRRVLRDLGLPDAMEMHDPVAVWCAIQMAIATQATTGYNAKSEWKTRKREFVIERFGEYTKGMCVVDRRGTNETVGTTRAIEGIVIDSHSSHVPGSTEPAAGVDVLHVTPDPELFAKEMMRRVFWFR